MDFMRMTEERQTRNSLVVENGEGTTWGNPLSAGLKKLSCGVFCLVLYKVFLLLRLQNQTFTLMRLKKTAVS
jgi:hypothetical protein